MDALRKIRVLVVDDSAFMRKAIRNILNSSKDMEVVATARDGLDAIKKVTDYQPDVITLDIEMPRLEGLQTLGYIMSECPTPVVMLSAYTESGGVTTMKALEYGAVDFVCKPSGPISLDLDKVEQELIAKVRTASQVDVRRLSFVDIERLVKGPTLPLAAPSERQAVVIATSTGGPRALYEIIPRLPADLPAPVLVVQHMSQGFTKSLADRMDVACALNVKEAEEGEEVKVGRVYIAPGNYHMAVFREGNREFIRLNQEPPRHSVRPSADVTLETAAKVYGANCLGVVLTGMGHDGAAGAKAVKLAGGQVVVQDEPTSVVFGMPKSAIDAGAADVILPLPDIAEEIVRRVRLSKANLHSF
ncbi:MAG: chemotaxis response regulator protein-glutamate methylesterase [Candidatus Firestonebacteria bacterium]|nr:chemotaxis response regulator protein-glutamate methylesterase [Candidatus Firestonebacteria bacterium]